MTQLEQAQKGLTTEEIKAVAANEGLPAALVGDARRGGPDRDPRQQE